MSLPILKSDIPEHYLDYTWLISGILYEGGTDLLIPELMKRGINEAHFYNVAGSPIGRKSIAGVADSFDVEQYHIVVSADQAESIFDFIYRFCNLSQPNKGIINLNKLSRSTQLDLPNLNDTANEEMSD